MAAEGSSSVPGSKADLGGLNAVEWERALSRSLREKGDDLVEGQDGGATRPR